MSPRTHNTLSYSVAALVFWAFLPQDAPGALWVGCLWGFHFLRRTLEALFVHRYGGRPVPPADFLVEYLYYWGFAVWIAWSLGRSAWSLPSVPECIAGALVFLVGEVGNAWAHQKLRALRSHAGESSKRIPEGGLFQWVSCPHYLFEVVSWCGFLLTTRLVASGVFLALGAAIVTSYARVRHQAYKHEFDGTEGRPLYPTQRKAIFPWIF